ncbi:sugar phosphate permease [Roseibium hamelinense]|uniref:Sugar phosphate permease n=1 Tax=Roseibium hamelinense TaxID=150831 RepID=A0A562T9H5_9HYPH|nr:MFS transporter [Roseibium hamelinense]MTI43540.1 MFS transporter [Roseibium hamelinense]TWI89666.1 sugar phosphate permease [Roseibium hamelinense]
MPFFAFLQANARWLGAGYLLALFSGFGQTFFISLFAGDLRAEFDLSHGDFGLIYMAATLLSALCLSSVGRTVDVFPIQRVAAVVMLALAAFCVSMATVNSVVMLFVTIFGLRLCGQGMMTHTSMTAMGRWFSAQRGRAVSIAILGFPTAEALFPISFVALSNAIGWRGAWGFAAAILVALSMPVILTLLRADRQPKSLESDGTNVIGRQWTRAEVLRDPVFWAACLGVLAPPFIGTAILFHQVYLVELRGWPLELFASAFVVMAVVSVATSLVLGGLIDRYTAVRLMPGLLVPMAAACFVLAYFTSQAAPFIFMALFGMSSGITATLIGALWPEIYGVRHIGAIRAVAFALMVFASAAGPGLVGWLIDLGIDYDFQLAGMGLYCILMSVVLTLASKTARLRDKQPGN